LMCIPCQQTRTHKSSLTHVSCILSKALVSVLSEAMEEPPAELAKLQAGTAWQAQHTAARSTHHGC
jgi:hypothetical protein